MKIENVFCRFPFFQTHHFNENLDFQMLIFQKIWNSNFDENRKLRFVVVTDRPEVPLPLVLTRKLFFDLHRTGQQCRYHSYLLENRFPFLQTLHFNEISIFNFSSISKIMKISIENRKLCCSVTHNTIQQCGYHSCLLGKPFKLLLRWKTTWSLRTGGSFQAQLRVCVRWVEWVVCF